MAHVRIRVSSLDLIDKLPPINEISDPALKAGKWGA